MKDEVREIWALPFKSQEIDQGPRVHCGRDTVTIGLDFENDRAECEWMSIGFEGVLGFAFTASSSCSVDQIAAYDKVVEVVSSVWRRELLSRRPDESALPRHYRLYLDDIGCYEVIAEKFVPPSDD